MTDYAKKRWPFINQCSAFFLLVVLCVALLFKMWYFCFVFFSIVTVCLLKQFLTFIETCWEEKNPWKYEFCENNTEALTNIGLQCPHNIDVCACLVFFFFLFPLFFKPLLSRGACAWDPVSSHETPSLFINLKYFLSSGRHFLFNFHFHLESSNPGLRWSLSVTSNWFQISSQATFYTLLQELYLSMSQEAFPFALSPLVPFW